jgi:F-type H+-transporting ATPase subunit alpha
VELLKQPQYTPFPVQEQVVSLWAGTTGKMDEVPVEDVRRFEAEFLDYLRREHSGLLQGIAETGLLDDDTTAALEDAISAFKQQFETSSGELLVKDEPVEALDQAEIGQEKVRKHVRRPPVQQQQ